MVLSSPESEPPEQDLRDTSTGLLRRTQINVSFLRTIGSINESTPRSSSGNMVADMNESTPRSSSGNMVADVQQMKVQYYPIP